MNALKLTLIALTAIVLAGCSPKRAPGQYDANGAPQTGNSSNSISDVQSNELSDNDSRGNDSTDQKVANWLKNNDIPPEAILCTVQFGFDKFNVEAGERSKLDNIAEAAKRDGIYIVGYSDFYGTEEYNLALSDKRAQAVKNYLNNIGSANSAQIQALGEQFAAKDGTKAEVAADRKVIVVDGKAAQ